MRSPAATVLRPVPRTPRTTRRRFGRGALAAALAVALAGCSGSAPAADPMDRPVLFPVTFINVVPIQSLTYTPEMIADITGLFEREGLRVEFQYVQGSASAIQNVLGGTGLVTRIGDAEAMAAIGGRGDTVTAVAQPSQRSTLRVVSLADDPVRTPADLRGRVVGLASLGGASEALVDTLGAAGGLAESDLRKQIVALGPGVLDNVRNGRVDAYVDTMDNAILLRQQEPDAVVLDPFESTASGTQMYIASQRALADPARRDAIVRYLRAIQAAMRTVIDDSSLDRTLEQLGTHYDIPILGQPELAKATLRDYIASWQANGELLRTVPERWERIYDESVGVGLVPGGLDPAKWFTNDLLTAGPS